jgi:hypothetical protein
VEDAKSVALLWCISTNVGRLLMVVVFLSLLTLKWTKVMCVANYAYTTTTFSPVKQVAILHLVGIRTIL